MQEVVQGKITKRRINPSERQRRVVELTVENISLKHPLTHQQIIEKAGYPVGACSNGIYKSLGVQKFLEQYRMTKPDLVSKVSEHIYNEDPKISLEGIKVASKLLGYEQPIKVQMQEKQQEGREKVFE